MFRDAYNVIGGVDKAIPVDVYAPGGAVRPETIIDAVLKGVEILDEKARRLEAGEVLRDPDDLLDDEAVNARLAAMKAREE